MQGSTTNKLWELSRKARCASADCSVSMYLHTDTHSETDSGDRRKTELLRLDFTHCKTGGEILEEGRELGEGEEEIPVPIKLYHKEKKKAKPKRLDFTQ